MKVFRLCLMKFGFGRWNEIVRSNYLIGKSVSQMCNQLQRMVGQQSIGEFFGLHLDPERIFEANQHREGSRKNGCLINTGANPTKEEVKKKREENELKFGIPSEERNKIAIPVLQESEMSANVLKTMKAKMARLDLLHREKERLKSLLDKIEGKTCSEPEDNAIEAAPVSMKRKETSTKSKSRTGKRKLTAASKKKKKNKKRNSEDVYADDTDDDSY